MSDILIISAAIFLLFFTVILSVRQLRDKKLTAVEKQIRSERNAAKQHNFLSTFFLTQNRITAISSALSSLSVYKSGQIAIMSVKFFWISTSLQIAIVGVGLFLFSDIFSLMTCIIVALFAGHVTIDRELERINLRVYKEMGHLLSSVRQEYLRTGSIPEALVSITPTKLMARPVAQIEDILTSSNGEEKLLKFYEASPFRMLF